MEKENRDEVHVDVVSQEDSQPKESNTNQQTFIVTCPLPLDIPTCCDLKILRNIKCEQILPENMREDSTDSQRGRGVDDRVVTGLQSVKCEGQRTELLEQQTIPPIMDTDNVLMKSCNAEELTEMKPEKYAEPGEYSRTSSETETRHWIVCPGGLLKEFKPEHTHVVSDTVYVEDVSKNDAKMECESQLSVRERKHTGVKHLIADTCGTSSNDLKGRDRPQPIIIVKPFTCDACGKSFDRRKNLRMHEKIHSGAKPFSCDKCGKSFTRSSHLREHERRHSGVKPFTCDKCGKSFAESSTLRVHDRIHSGVKPFTCDKCGKSFTWSSTLKQHELIHTGVKPFMCDACGKSFTRSSLFELHKKMHTGVKPFTCDVCEKSFTRSSALK